MLYTAYRNNMSGGYNGSYVGTSPNPTSTYIGSSVMQQKAGYQNPLYYPHTSNWNGTAGYWLASPCANNTRTVMALYYNGCVDNGYYYNTLFAFRPLVCLPSSVLE